MDSKLVVRAQYGRGWRAFSWVSLFILLALACVSTIKGETVAGGPSFLVIGGVSFAIVIPLLLEFHFVEIGIEDDTLITQSPWRRSRVVPLSSVESCDFSSMNQWYRIKTQNHGVIRMHIMLSGLPNVLWHLPCEIPRGPIKFLDADGKWTHPVGPTIDGGEGQDSPAE